MPQHRVGVAPRGAVVRRAMVAAVLAGVAAAAPPAGAAGPPGAQPARAAPDQPEPKGPAAARALREEAQINSLIASADTYARDHRASCRPPAPPRQSAATHDVPSTRVLEAFAALRRPQAPIDVFPERSPLPGYGTETYIDYTRTVTAANGKQFLIVPARETPWYVVSADCLDFTHDRLVRLVADAAPRLRSRTLRQFGRMRRSQERTAARARTPYDTVMLFQRAANGTPGSGGGGGSFGWFLTHGNLLSTGTRGGRSQVTGLLPDGVASITLVYPKRVSRGRYYKPKVFRKKAVVTAPVRENVFSVRVPRSAEDASPTRAVWRAADGHAVRVVKR